jgi:hypothetical protein
MKKSAFVLTALLCAAACFSTAASAGSDNNTFDRFIKPMTNPVYFDDARNQTYVHVFHAIQTLPDKINTRLGRVPLDGDLRLTAVRINYAFNERFSLVAAKDGYIDFNPDQTLKHESGWGDIAAGAKYAFIYDPKNEFILSGKLLFEMSQGSRDVYQGNGHGNLAPSLTFLKGWDKFQFTGMVGGVIPFQNSEESTMVSDSWHVSYNIIDKIFPLVELNHMWVVRQAERKELVASIARFEGGDVINLGSQHGMDHRHLVSAAAGARFRIIKNIDLGFAYEFPLTDRKNGLMDNRWNFDVVFHF